MSRVCARIAESAAFQNAILGVILLNAVVLGLQTYDGIDRDYGDVLDLLNEVFLAVFVVELAIRIAAHGRRPQDFFRRGWNVFDFLIIAAAFAPGVRENSTILRLVRLLRVVRVASVLPDLRVFITAFFHSIPAISSLAVMTTMLLFVYGMVGWMLFDDELPGRWGDIGTAVLTLFTALTIENWPDLMYDGMKVHSWSWVYFVSYVLIAAFLLINMLLAVVISSIEEAREIVAAREAAERASAVSEEARSDDEEQRLTEAIASIRSALVELEGQVRARQRAR
jgi:voltage-gated sodium channel